MSVVLIFCACILAERGWERVMSSQVQAEEKKWTVVIDAGHGGTLSLFFKKNNCGCKTAFDE